MWLAKPLTCKQIAQELLISPATVRVHASVIYSKVHVRTRFEFIALMERATVTALEVLAEMGVQDGSA